MAYTKTNWVNGQAPAINSTNLNNMEQGIEDAHTGLDDLDGAVTALNTPKFELDTQNGINLKNGVGGATFERTQSTSKSTTAVNSYGELEYYDNDEPRRGTKGLPLEPQATNLFLHSNDFNNAVWGNSTNTRIGGQASPDGGNNAFLIETTVTNDCQLFQDVTFSSNTSTISYIVKAGNSPYLTIRYVGYDTTARALFDLDNETATNLGGDNATIKKYNDSGWYKVELTLTLTGSDLVGQIYAYIATDGTGSGYGSPIGNNMYIFVAQLEEGSIATSYIPTTTTAVTRSRDTLVLDPRNFPSITDNVTIHTKWNIEQTDGAERRLFSCGTSSTNRVDIWIRNGFVTFVTTTGTLRQIDSSISASYGVIDFKFIMSDVYNELYINGVLAGTESRGGDNILASIPAQLGIGKYLSDGFEANSEHIFTKIYDYAMTPSQARL